MNTLEHIMTYNPVVDDTERGHPGKLVLPNTSRLDFIKIVRALDFKVGVEVGVAKGDYALLLVYHNPQLKLYGVDPYIAYDEYTDFPTTEIIDKLKSEMQGRMVNWVKRGRFQHIELTSVEAAKQFDDESLDFVYIDANHAEKYVYEDITIWARKVRKGGMVVGDDYAGIKKWGVRNAVKRYTKENNIKWFIFGRRHGKTGEMSDPFRNWFFIKE